VVSVSANRNGEETEVTPEMIEAGVEAIRSCEYELWEERDPRELADLVVEIYLAVERQRVGALSSSK
jgi:hypothetical protein